MSIQAPPSLAELVRRFRLAAALSQEELAERSGLSARQISDLERGLRKEPRLETIRMLAESLTLTEQQRAALLVAARPELQDRHEPSPSDRVPKFTLPAPSHRLIGRDRQLADVVSLVLNGDNRLLTLTGPGGVGKTRLALEIAHRAAPSFANSAVFIDLAPITSHELVATSIAQTLGIRETGARTIPEMLRAALTASHLLLVLDNFEQVIDAAPIVSDLLVHAPRLQVLVTSRELLRIRGELGVQVEPLDLPDPGADALDTLAEAPAVALFAETAKLVNPSFELSPENAKAVAEICRRIDGLPLAIELAASRVKRFPPAMLLQDMDHRLALLTGGPRDLHLRQQSLRNTIAWSYELLPAAEQALFRRLGVFLGGTTLQGIEAVMRAFGEPDLSLLSGIASLADKSLIRESEGPDGSPRFSMLETVREFALEQLRENAELSEALEAHARHYFAVAETDRHGIGSPLGNPPLLRVQDAEIENFRAAINWFDDQHNVPALAQWSYHMWGYFYSRWLVREGQALCLQTLEMAENHPISDGERGLVLVILSHAATLTGDAARGEMLARESLVLLDHSPAYRDHIPWCHIYLATALREQGRFAEAAKAAHAAYDTAVRGDEQYFIPFALYHRGHMAFLQEHFERATVLLEESCMFACGSIVAQGNAGRRPPPGAKCPGRQPLRQPVRILVAKTV